MLGRILASALVALMLLVTAFILTHKSKQVLEWQSRNNIWADDMLKLYFISLLAIAIATGIGSFLLLSNPNWVPFLGTLLVYRKIP